MILPRTRGYLGSWNTCCSCRNPNQTSLHSSSWMVLELGCRLLPFSHKRPGSRSAFQGTQMCLMVEFFHSRLCRPGFVFKQDRVHLKLFGVLSFVSLRDFSIFGQYSTSSQTSFFLLLFTFPGDVFVPPLIFLHYEPLPHESSWQIRIIHQSWSRSIHI